MLVNDTGAGLLAAAAAAVGRRSSTSPATTSSAARSSGAPTSSPTSPSRSPPTAARSGRARRSTAVANPLHLIVRSSWLFGLHGHNFVETMLRLAGEQPEVIVVSDQVGCPTYTRHLAPRPGGAGRGRGVRDPSLAAAGRCSWFDFAQEIFDQASSECRVMAAPPRCSPARRPGPPSRSSARSATSAPALPDWRQGLRRVPRASGRRSPHERLLVTGGAGFIGSAYVRHRLAAHPGRLDPRARQAHLRRAAARTSRASRTLRARRGRHRRRRGVAEAIDGCDALVNFAAESHVDRSIEAPGEFIQTDVFGTFVLLEAAATAGIRHLQISTDEVYGVDRRGLVHRGLAASIPPPRTRRPRPAAT